MSYYIDLSTITLEDFFTKLQDVSVLPSQKILRDTPKKDFLRLRESGIRHAGDLLTALKSKDKAAQVSQATGLSSEYLTLVRRELDRYQPKPILFKDIPGLKEDVLEKLKRNGVNNTMHLFDRVIRAQNRQELARQTGISLDDVVELTKLTDVCRIMWTTPSFARLLVEAGYDSVPMIAVSDPAAMYAELAATNGEKMYLKSRLGERDVVLFVRYAKDVPPAIEW